MTDWPQMRHARVMFRQPQVEIPTDLRARLEAARLDLLALFRALDRMHLPLMMRDNILPAYAKQTGGNFDGEFRQKGIETSFAKIAEEVRTQYTVGYYTHEPFIDGKYRSVEVKVLRPNLTIISKLGYWPTAEDSKPPVVTPMAK